MLPPSTEYAVYALVCIGTGDAVNKRAGQVGIPVGAYLLVQSPFFLCAVLVIALFTTGIHLKRTDIVYSLGQGYASVNYAVFRLSFVFSSALALVFFMESLVFPLIHMSFIVTFVIAISFLGEKPGRMQILGVIAAAAAIIILVW